MLSTEVSVTKRTLKRHINVLPTKFAFSHDSYNVSYSTKIFSLKKKLRYWDITMLHNEDRELQIKLAELQADVQINLTVCFGFLAVFITTIIGFQQIYFSLPPEATLLKDYLSVSIVVIAFTLLGVSFYFINKAQDARKQMNKLRKQYIW